MGFGEQDQLGLSCRFEVDVGGFSLGSWTSCNGLNVTFQHEKVKELGQHAYMTYIPGRAEYSPIVLQRAITSGDWAKTKTWLEKVTDDGWLVSAPGDTSTTITLKDSKRGEVAKWTLKNAIPSAWEGPKMDAKGNQVALETLKLVHEGFLDD